MARRLLSSCRFPLIDGTRLTKTRARGYCRAGPHLPFLKQYQAATREWLGGCFFLDKAVLMRDDNRVLSIFIFPSSIFFFSHSSCYSISN